MYAWSPATLSETMIVLPVLRPMVPLGARGGSLSEISKFQISNALRHVIACFIFVGSMSDLSKWFALLCAAVASFLLLCFHINSLYSGDDIAAALSIVADVEGDGMRTHDQERGCWNHKSFTELRCLFRVSCVFHQQVTLVVVDLCSVYLVLF